MELFVIVIVLLPILIITLHSIVKSSLHMIIIKDNSNKNKIKLGDRTPQHIPNTQDKIYNYLKISSQVKCTNMTVNYLTTYLIFMSIIFITTIL